MAIWYEVQKSKDGIVNFMRSNSCFHDYRIERIEYVAGKDYVDLFLKIDQTEGVLLRFVDIASVKVNGNIDYKADCLWACTLLLLENGNFIWFSEDYEDFYSDHSYEDLSKLKEYSTWVEAKRVLWAATDSDGVPVEMPTYHIDCDCVYYDKKYHEHYDIVPFTGNFEDILKPKY